MQEEDDDGKGSDEDAALDVLFNEDGSRNMPCRCARRLGFCSLSLSYCCAGTKMNWQGSEIGR